MCSYSKYYKYEHNVSLTDTYLSEVQFLYYEEVHMHTSKQYKNLLDIVNQNDLKLIF